MLRRKRSAIGIFTTLALALTLTGHSTTGPAATATSLFNQLGGMDAVTKLGNSLLSGLMKDPRLTSVLGKVNPALASPKVANQLCSVLGGGCAAPFTNQQVAAAASKLSPDQQKAVSENFKTALGSVSSNPLVQQAVSKALGSNLSGIVGALL